MTRCTFELSNNNGGPFQNICVKSGDKNLSLNVSRCPVPFGVSENNSKKDMSLVLGDKHTSMIMLFAQYDKDAMTKIEELIIEDNDGDIVYNQTVQQPNKKYDPYFKVRINDATLIYDDAKVLKSVNDIKKGAFVDVKFECGGIWVMKDIGKAGTTWYAKEIKILPMKKIGLAQQAQPAKQEVYEFNEDDM